MSKARDAAASAAELSNTLRDLAAAEEIDRKSLKKAVIRSLVLSIADDPTNFKATELLAKVMGWGAEKKPQEDASQKEALSKRLDTLLAAARAERDRTMPVSQGDPNLVMMKNGETP